MKEQFDATQVYGLAGLKRGLCHRRAVYKSPIRGAEILKCDTAIVDSDLTMRAGDRWVGDLEVVGEPRPIVFAPGLSSIPKPLENLG